MPTGMTFGHPDPARPRGDGVTPAPDNHYRFAHLSDLHLSDPSPVSLRQLAGKRLLGYLSWRRRRRHEHRPEVLAALCRDLSAAGLSRLLISGDLTHLGLPGEFRQCRQWLEALACPVAVVPGNHESYVAEPWSDTYGHWQDFFDGAGEAGAASLEDRFPTFATENGIAFIGLATARPTAPFFATGSVGGRQLEKLAALLADSAEQGLFRVVWLHHPPLAGDEKWRKRLEDAPALMAVLEERGVELLLHGHSHRSLQRTVTIAGRQVPVIAVPSGSAVGRHGEIACYNTMTLSATGDEWQLAVTSRQLDPEAMAFVPGATARYVIPRDGTGGR